MCNSIQTVTQAQDQTRDPRATVRDKLRFPKVSQYKQYDANNGYIEKNP